MQECRFEFDTSYRNDYWIHFSNNQFINRILEGYAWPALTVSARKLSMYFSLVSNMLQVKFEKNPDLIKINLKSNLTLFIWGTSARQVTLMGELTFVSHVNHKEMYEKLVCPAGMRVTFLPMQGNASPRIQGLTNYQYILHYISQHCFEYNHTFTLVLYNGNKISNKPSLEHSYWGLLNNMLLIFQCRIPESIAPYSPILTPLEIPFSPSTILCPLPCHPQLEW